MGRGVVVESLEVQYHNAAICQVWINDIYGGGCCNQPARFFYLETYWDVNTCSRQRVRRERCFDHLPEELKCQARLLLAIA